MRIVMLGHSNAGKTTYMSAMYQIGRQGVKGFRIRTADPAREADLLRDAAALQQGRFPPPSSRRSVHDFVLSHRGADVMNFAWNDYRGGALLDRSGDGDTAQVLTDLGAADGIVLFVDAQALASEQPDERSLRRLTYLLQRSFGESDRTMPFVIAYTKSDLVPDVPDVWASIDRQLASIIDASDSASQIVATRVPVACGARPRNVAVPLLWCLSHGLLAEITRREDQVTATLAAEQQAKANASVINDISSWFNGTESYTRQAFNARQKAQQEVRELRPLVQPAQRLATTVARQHRAGADTMRHARASARNAGADRRDRETKAVLGGILVFVLIATALIVMVIVVLA